MNYRFIDFLFFLPFATQREGKGGRVFGLIEMKRRYRSIGSVNKSLLIARNVETDWFGCFPAIVDIDDVDLRCGFRLGVDI